MYHGQACSVIQIQWIEGRKGERNKKARDREKDRKRERGRKRKVDRNEEQE